MKSFISSSSTINVPVPWTDVEKIILMCIILISCLFSIIGCSLIMVSYFLWSDTRTKLRRLLVILSFCDLITAVGYAVGVLNGGKNMTPLYQECVVQSAFTTFSSMASFMWTMAIALYLFLQITRRRKYAGHALILFHFFAWGIPLILVISALFCSALGQNNVVVITGTVGWCWIKNSPSGKCRGNRLFWELAAGKVIEITAYISTPIIYLITKWNLPKKTMQKTDSYDDIVSGAVIKHEIEILQEADKKLILVPAVFVFVRMWGTLRWILSYAIHPSVNNIYWLAMLQGIGDSAQGWANFLLFCVFTAKIRRKYLRLLRCAFCREKDVGIDEIQ
eukprot:TRINITY_DN13529_c0_g1_i1.p1 TRINITY_DN13529_c0_g1~~TRINITY_DN13529_c0_g1_i1.p1  ORF type:complete len:335 (+),score=13.78 TRINITY_DN13529_c0_g1_i1:8-1012(+)